MKTIFSITIGKKRDVLLAQLRARQLTRMLGLEPLEQSRIVCLIFEAASEELRCRRSFALTFRVENRQLQVLCVAPRFGRANLSSPPTSRLVASLPIRPATLAVEDVFWAMEHIQQMSKPNLFDEIRQQNRDLLLAIGELRPAPALPVRLAS